MMTTKNCISEAINVKLFATDLDGTLLRNDKTISDTDLSTLIAIREHGIVSVAATGRNIDKVYDVVPSSASFDYVVFSSGAGLYDWQNRKILWSEHFRNCEVGKIASFLIENDYNFNLYKQIPDNSNFFYFKGSRTCAEFERYLSLHSQGKVPLDLDEIPESASQFLVVIPNNVTQFEALKEELHSISEYIKVIRTTSPVNTEFIWLEIFPETVSKGHGLDKLCAMLSIEKEATLCIGNDYNDIDMLDFVGTPFVVGNAPDDLKSKYQSVATTNNESCVSHVFSLIKGNERFVLKP